MKDEIRKHITLSAYKPEDQLFLEVDSSYEAGFGYLLYQEDLEGNKRIIKVGSTGISSAQKSYSVYELESCGAAFAMTQCRSYLWGRQFVLRTDHKALLNLENKDLDKIKNNRLI